MDIQKGTVYFVLLLINVTFFFWPFVQCLCNWRIITYCLLCYIKIKLVSHVNYFCIYIYNIFCISNHYNIFFYRLDSWILLKIIYQEFELMSVIWWFSKYSLDVAQGQKWGSDSLFSHWSSETSFLTITLHQNATHLSHMKWLQMWINI